MFEKNAQATLEWAVNYFETPEELVSYLVQNPILQYEFSLKQHKLNPPMYRKILELEIKENKNRKNIHFTLSKKGAIKNNFANLYVPEKSCSLTELMCDKFLLKKFGDILRE